MKNKLVTLAFLLMLAAFVTVLALPADEESIARENRTRSTPPPLNTDTVFSGSFASGFESFIGDSIGYRSFFTTLAQNADSYKGFTPETGRIISTNKDIGTGTTQKQTLLVADNAIIEMFSKNPEQEKVYAETVNEFAAKLPNDIKVYNMIIPTQLSFKEPIYKNLQDDQQKAIESIYSMLDESVTPIDAYSALGEHKDEYIYFRTDHHWTQRGAYYAYRAFMDAEGGESVDINNFESNTFSGFLGSLYDKVNDPSLSIVPDTVEWFDVDPEDHVKTVMHAIDENGKYITYKTPIYVKEKANYSFFLGGDHAVAEMKNSDNPDGKTLVVIKESYSNALAPWLIKSYGTVVLVDPRNYKGKFEDILNEYSPDEVLITNYIFTTNFNDYCALMSGMYQD
jgi:hypothetical protein